MNDLEIVKKCALKYYGDSIFSDVHGRLYVEPMNSAEVIFYDPLHNDEQAMALVKKYGIQICRDENGDWNTKIMKTRFALGSAAFRFPDLNRAICECVARLPD